MRTEEHITSPLTDRFGRTHTYLRLSLTEFCNFKCRYCVDVQEPSSSSSRFLTADEIEQIVADFSKMGIRKLRLTGGEPLVRNDIEEVLKRISKHSLELAISTNGFLVPKYRHALRNAGIRKANISLDSLQSKRFSEITGVDALHNVIEAIDLLIEDAVEVRVNCVVMKGINDNEILDLIDFSRNRPIRIRFIEFMPFAGNAWSRDQVIPSSEILNQIQSVYSVEKLQDELNATDSAYAIPGFMGTFGFISTVSQPFCDSCNRLRITADGRLKNCLFSAHELDLKSLLRQGQSIHDAVMEAVQAKHKQHGGQTLSVHMNNRSMLHIGG